MTRSWHDSLLDGVDEAAEGVVDLCARLVAAPSVNPPGDTREVAAVVRDELAGHGLPSELVAVDPTMPSVVAELDSGRPGPHLVLNVHLDTMEPGDLSAWTVPVWEMTRRDGRLYGLGMGNMKGAVAAMLTAYRLLARHRASWTGRVTLTAVSDECVFGDNGAAHLLASRPEQVVGDALICGEGPGMMRLALAEKGVAWFEVLTAADGGHASRAQRGQTAPARLAAALLALDGLNDLRVPRPTGLEGVPEHDTEAGRLSVNVGVLSGGSFVSQLARSASALLDVRVPPGLSLVEVEQELDRRLEGTGARWRRTKGWEANWSGTDVPFVAAFAEVAAAVRQQPCVPTVRLPASDASRWRRLGVPAVCYGPQPGLSAGVDDHALEQDVLDCARVYALAAARFLAP
ncbi:MAG: Acetylornithine deacetylase [uncultured Frankineae bacterium]|uniref:Acetylornithine deacetylase n=1 Tax=uncultured Frankineae bacterium TaxID=437475 RepID=A0A6J4LHF4_9ACTN|nr:MAG: Acetylornithine deacetylase [uncultured Frankineae bacterium]